MSGYNRGRGRLGGDFYKAKYGGRRGRGFDRGGQDPERRVDRQETPRLRQPYVVNEPALFSRDDGGITLPYGYNATKPRQVSELSAKLQRWDGAGYGAYKDLERTCWVYDGNQQLCVIIDRVQSDPYAPPSRCRLVATKSGAKLPDIAFESDAAAIAAADWLCRRFFDAARRRGDDMRTETGGWGGKKGGEIRSAEIKLEYLSSAT